MPVAYRQLHRQMGIASQLSHSSVEGREILAEPQRSARSVSVQVSDAVVVALISVFGVIVAALISALATVVAALIQSRKHEQD
jgi:hypothetical protein